MLTLSLIDLVATLSVSLHFKSAIKSHNNFTINVEYLADLKLKKCIFSLVHKRTFIYFLAISDNDLVF